MNIRAAVALATIGLASTVPVIASAGSATAATPANPSIALGFSWGESNPSFSWGMSNPTVRAQEHGIR